MAQRNKESRSMGAGSRSGLSQHARKYASAVLALTCTGALVVGSVTAVAVADENALVESLRAMSMQLLSEDDAGDSSGEAGEPDTGEGGDQGGSGTGSEDGTGTGSDAGSGESGAGSEENPGDGETPSEPAASEESIAALRSAIEDARQYEDTDYEPNDGSYTSEFLEATTPNVGHTYVSQDIYDAYKAALDQAKALVQSSGSSPTQSEVDAATEALESAVATISDPDSYQGDIDENIARWYVGASKDTDVVATLDKASGKLIVRVADGVTSSDVKQFSSYYPGSLSTSPWRGRTDIKSVEFENPSAFTCTDLQYWFYKTSSLETVESLPPKLADMTYTFASCSSLTSVCELPQTLERMYATFNACSSLAAAPELPSNIRRLTRTFESCSLLATAPDLPEGVTNLAKTFSGCTSLTEAPTIPASVQTLYSTFSSCSSLSEFPTFEGADIRTFEGAFAHCTSLVEVPDMSQFVQVGNLDGWDDANAYGQSSHVFRRVFQHCTALTKVGELPPTIEQMHLTFQGCTSLVEPPAIPSTVTVMSGTFQDCTNLKHTADVSNLARRYSYNQISSLSNGTSGCYENCPNLQYLTRGFSLTNHVSSPTLSYLFSTDLYTPENPLVTYCYAEDYEELSQYDWSQWNRVLRVYEYGTGDGSGSGPGTGPGDGDGSGNGTGDGSGSGNGSGSGAGDGDQSDNEGGASGDTGNGSQGSGEGGSGNGSEGSGAAGADSEAETQNPSSNGEPQTPSEIEKPADNNPGSSTGLTSSTGNKNKHMAALSTEGTGSDLDNLESDAEDSADAEDAEDSEDSEEDSSSDATASAHALSYGEGGGGGGGGVPSWVWAVLLALAVLAAAGIARRRMAWKQHLARGAEGSGAPQTGLSGEGNRAASLAEDAAGAEGGEAPGLSDPPTGN